MIIRSTLAIATIIACAGCGPVVTCEIARVDYKGAMVTDTRTRLMFGGRLRIEMRHVCTDGERTWDEWIRTPGSEW